VIYERLDMKTWPTLWVGQLHVKFHNFCVGLSERRDSELNFSISLFE
jgi:hypothetical protein